MASWPMLALRDLQAAFAAHLRGEDRPGLAEAVVGDTISAAARLLAQRGIDVRNLDGGYLTWRAGTASRVTQEVRREGALV